MKYHNLILLRGVSGAGKSTIAELFTDAVLVSTDDYFMVDGEYVFNANNLVINHQKCQDEVESVMHDINKTTLCTIVVHNTFTQQWEMKAYYDLAKKYKFTVHTLIVENRHGSTSTHNVPQKSIDNQRDRFDVVLT